MIAVAEPITGRAYPLGRDNVDTDVILPARFLKTITRTGLGVAAFETIRAEPGNVFDRPELRRAPILVAGANFGCGSSREHAVWAMMDLGLRAVVAEGFSDIFSGNAFKNGLLAVTLSRGEISRALAGAERGPLTVDLAAQEVRLPWGEAFAFEIDAFRKDCLVRGVDEIALTLARHDQIAAFEKEQAGKRPWLAVPG